MKKLILLALVLALVSSASAALSWNVSGTYAANQTLTLTLSDTRTDVSELSLAWIDDGSAGGTAIVGTINTKLAQGLDAGYAGGSYGIGDDAGDIVSVYGAANLGAYATGTLYTFTYTLPSALPASITWTMKDVGDWGTYSIVRYSNGETVQPPPGVTITPEPMTIALLGLGGLFLRRKLS